MGKKRKASSKFAERDAANEAPQDSSRKRIRTFEDVADSEDEFHLNQDRLLLDESAANKRARERRERDAFLEQSDEEVLGQDGASSDVSGDVEDEEEEEGWGTSRADLYGADAIETEEQALEEEAEALRLQKKHLQTMSAADYGFDETEWQDSADNTQAQVSGVVKETLPELQVSASLSDAERLKLLKSRYPEFEPLRKELIAMTKEMAFLEREKLTGPWPGLEVKEQTLSAYLAALAVYFALLTAGSNTPSLMPAAQLRDHAIMSALVQCRAQWHEVKDLSYDDLREPSEVEYVSDEDGNYKPVLIEQKKSKKQQAIEAADAAKEAKMHARLDLIEADFAKLTSSLDRVMAGPRLRKPIIVDGEAQLTAAQAAEKANKRKSLRFYTSQIAQKANKRSAAGRVAGGDDDVPHRERLRDRQIRLNAEAEKRGRKDVGDDLGGASDEEDATQARRIRDEVDEDDYYDMIAAKSSKKKADKAALAQAQRLAAEQGGRVIEEETVGLDGKRKITYAIEKNKGLTPHRHKDVRNPRVKKRKKFEQKTKKLASMKPTYKGGEGRGGYGGELTGIKSNLVRSVKL